MNRPLKILHTVEQYLPFRCGMQEVVTRISEALVKKGHYVTVATSRDPARTSNIINGVQIVDFDIKGNYVNSYLWGETRKYQDFLLSSDFDIIVNFAAQQWATDLCLPLLSQIKGKKVFVPTGFSGLFWGNYENYFKQMPHWLKQYDQIIVHADEYQDAHFLREHGVKNYKVIPNGASKEEFSAPILSVKQELGIPDTSKVILLVGNHTGTKGHSAAIDMFIKANIDNAALVIAGKVDEHGCSSTCKRKESYFKHFPFITFDQGRKGAFKRALRGLFDGSTLSAYRKNKKLLVVELSREKLVSLFKESYLFIFPSEIECFPIVIIEAMAAGLPAIVSNAGSMRELIMTSQAGLVLPTRVVGGFSHVNFKEGAEMIEQMFNDSSLHDRMAQNAKSIYEQRYSWEAIVSEYENEYFSICSKYQSQGQTSDKS